MNKISGILRMLGSAISDEKSSKKSKCSAQERKFRISKIGDFEDAARGIVIFENLGASNSRAGRSRRLILKGRELILRK